MKQCFSLLLLLSLCASAGAQKYFDRHEALMSFLDYHYPKDTTKRHADIRNYSALLRSRIPLIVDSALQDYETRYNVSMDRHLMQLAASDFLATYALQSMSANSGNGIDTIGDSLLLSTGFKALHEFLSGAFGKTNSSLLYYWAIDSRGVEEFARSIAKNHPHQTPGAAWGPNYYLDDPDHWYESISRPLENSYAYLEIDCPISACDIMINGQLKDEKTDKKFVLPISQDAADTEVRVLKAGYNPYIKTVKLKKNKWTVVHAELH